MILVAGSANLDFVVRAPHIPAPSETVLGQAFKTYLGGKGANQAVACAKAGGATTRMLLALGNNPLCRASSGISGGCKRRAFCGSGP
ncbi:MAG: PfkB family carbohydrate kinase [Rhodoferax sp.]|nr:PfkB family carbohydrate kinase [Rhodoferax sp.]